MNRKKLFFVLFVTFRLSLLAFWPADQLARWSDYDYYYEIAGWVDQGLWPYLHYWVEYPPLFAYLSTLLYLLTPHYLAFAGALALTQLLFEFGSLALVYRMTLGLRGEAQAERTVWTYALLFAPVATWWLSFDAITTFFLLLTIERWVAERRVQSALAMGIGGLVKWFPLLFLPVALRFRRSWRAVMLYAVITMAIVGLGFGLLLALSPTYTLASLRSLGARASWQTVWALLDGNLGTGAYQADRLDPRAAGIAQGAPARVPTWLTTLLFGLLYVWLWLRPVAVERTENLLRLSAMTVLLFFLWSRGWSPQWLGMLVPLVLLSLPLERAALYLVVLTLVSVVEWPVLLSRGMNGWLYLTVLLRTVLFVALLTELHRKLKLCTGAR